MVKVISSRRFNKLLHDLETSERRNHELAKELDQVKARSKVQGSRILGLKILQRCSDECSSIEERNKLELLCKIAEYDMCYSNVVTYCLPGRSSRRKVLVVDPRQIPWTYEEMKNNLRKILNFLEEKDSLQSS